MKIDKKIYPFLAILLVSVFFFYYDPPHSICTTQLESYKKTLKGRVYDYLDKKNIIPAKILSSIKACREGKTEGSCLEYFEIINFTMNNLNQLELECMPAVLEEKKILDSLKNFFIITTVLSWGNEVPKDVKTSWFSSSNILTYCKVRRFLETYMNIDEFDKLVQTSVNNFPFEKLSSEISETSPEYLQNKAILKMNKEEVFNKSILSIKCERYL